MSSIVAVIDYGMGNLHSVASALEHVGADKVLVTHDAAEIARAGAAPQDDDDVVDADFEEVKKDK